MNQNVGIALVLARNVPDITMDSAKHASMAITWMAKRVRSVMLIVRLVLVLSPLNVQDAQRDSFWMLPQTLLFQRSEILLIFVELFVMRTQKDFIMFWQGITVPMSARIDHHSLVITGQI